MMHGIPLMMPDLSVKFNDICFGTFLSAGVPGSIPGLATYFHFSFHFFMKGSCQLLGKYVHEVLVNRLGGLSLPRKSVVRLTDRPDMTLDVYRSVKNNNATAMQQLF